MIMVSVVVLLRGYRNCGRDAAIEHSVKLRDIQGIRRAWT